MYIATGKGGYFFSSRENTFIIFHLVSIVKYNNIIYVNVIIIHSDVSNPGPVSKYPLFKDFVMENSAFTPYIIGCVVNFNVSMNKQ
jgi:hypothetical protein